MSVLGANSYLCSTDASKAPLGRHVKKYAVSEVVEMTVRGLSLGVTR